MWSILNSVKTFLRLQEPDRKPNAATVPAAIEQTECKSALSHTQDEFQYEATRLRSGSLDRNVLQAPPVMYRSSPQQSEATPVWYQSNQEQNASPISNCNARNPVLGSKASPIIVRDDVENDRHTAQHSTKQFENTRYPVKRKLNQSFNQLENMVVDDKRHKLRKHTYKYREWAQRQKLARSGSTKQAFSRYDDGERYINTKQINSENDFHARVKMATFMHASPQPHNIERTPWYGVNSPRYSTNFTIQDFDEHLSKLLERHSTFRDTQRTPIHSEYFERYSPPADILEQKSTEKLQPMVIDLLSDDDVDTPIQVFDSDSSSHTSELKEDNYSESEASTPKQSLPDSFHQLSETAIIQALNLSEMTQVEEEFDHGKPDSDVVSTCFGVRITRRDIQTLRDGTWLNDEIVNTKMNLLNVKGPRIGSLEVRLPKVYCWTTHFYTKLYEDNVYDYKRVRRWTKRKKLNVLDYDKIVVPVNLANVHWTLAIIDLANKRFEYLDAMMENNLVCLENLSNWIRDEVQDKHGITLDVSSWEKICRKDIPPQSNGCDCGVFLCQNAEVYGFDIPATYTQDDLSTVRKRIAADILANDGIRL